jgi:hypothetical protein
MSILNQDTIWIVSSESLMGGVFRTTNGGLNWTQQFSGGTENPNKIYMFNSRIGFFANNNSGLIHIRKTSNGGINWSIVVTNEGFRDMHFIDSLTGWRAWSVDSIKKTTDGGITWFKKLLPPSQNFGESGIFQFSFLNKDTIWAVGAIKYFTPTLSEVRGIIYISTNGGESWGYQLPDPNQINVYRYYFVNFINKLNGWAYTTNKGVHTVTGGDITFYTDVIQKSSKIPNQFLLKQNYPNPFNPRTVIGYELKKAGDIKIKVYSITGSEVFTLVNQKQSAGIYEVDMPGIGLSSGVYFYSLIVDDKRVDSKSMVLIK